MRGTRTRRKVIIANSRNRARRVASTIKRNSPRNVWVVNDDGHPKSPLSIERLPRNVERNVSKIARVKPTTSNRMACIRRGTPEVSFPFFIDKTPCEEPVDGTRSRERSFMNESIVILDSPSVSTEATRCAPELPVRELRRQESVDTVDLCSEGEEERSTTKGTKRKKRREAESGKRRKLCVEAQDDQQPDVIVLDDDEEGVGRSSNNNTSIIVESVHVKASNKSRCNVNPPETSCASGPSETQTRRAGESTHPSTGKDSKFRSRYFDKGRSIHVPLEKELRSRNTNPGSSKNYNVGDSSSKPELLDTVGSNVFNPCRNVQQTGLRPVIIDGCNVAIAHGGNRMFSVRGLCICVEYFLRRGHDQVVALVPLHQRSKVSPLDRGILESLKDDSHLVFTPSRFIDNRLISSYDDRYIVQYAAAVGGVIVSRDNYRDLLVENPAWRDTITNRLLMPTWVGDILMFPVDPLGKSGPSLDDFLRFPNK